MVKKTISCLLGTAWIAASSLVAQEAVQIPFESAASPEALRPMIERDFDGKATTRIQYDDGEIDTGYGATPTVQTLDLAMRFDLPEAGMKLDSVEICLLRGGTDSTLDLSISVWRPSASGTPGVLIDTIPAQATGVSPGGSFYTFDLSAQNVIIPGSAAFLGIGWNVQNDPEIFFCGDQDGTTVRPGFLRIDQGAWSSLTNLDADYNALILRGTFESEEPGTGDCTPSATALCLNDDRFRVETDWRRPDGQTGQGQAVQLTDDTGYFWFFNAANVEMVLKVLDGCPVNDHYWVFAGGLTNVEVDITVTDTATGAVSTYTNPLRTPFQPIQDTQAFATCP